ncbi:hypothetical protein HDU96_004060 [Phlyctochytrium bullatum]|nr:hypothetical protein HDU96_004060 [Phlyctochytrium bullatum]
MHRADIWDLDFLASGRAGIAPSASKPEQESAAADPFDFSIFESKPSISAPTVSQESRFPNEETGMPAPTKKPDLTEIPVPRSTDSDDTSDDDSDGEYVGRGKDVMSEKISTLADMGFDRDSAANALEAASWNLELALDLLMSNREASHRIEGRRPNPDTSGTSSRADIAQSQVTATATIFGKTVLSNAKSMFEFSKKKISEAYTKASEKIAEQVEALNVKADVQTSGNAVTPDDKGFWKDRWSDNDKPFPTYEPYTDSSSDEESLRKPPRKSNIPTHGEHLRSTLPAQTEDLFAQDNTFHNSPLSTAGSFSRSDHLSNMAKSSRSSTLPAQRDTPPAPVSKPKPSPVSLASPEQIQAADTARESGNAKFKDGQYSEAEAFYNAALSHLPSGDWGRIPILNNRAAARQKIGDHNGVIDDCTEVQLLNPEDTKSLLRRATAYEAKEKWELAKKDYETIFAKDSSVKGVSAALTRVRKALSAEANPSSSEMPLPKSTVKKPAVRNNTNPLADLNFDAPAGPFFVSKKVAELRERSDKLEKEEALKLSLQDAVDAKINLWKNGKDSNIRALLSSLDMVLWPDLNWKAINLSELITPQQVKVKYMKAIAKVHPDKLKPDTTVEQKMLANNVFAVLNKAWDSFKASNNL